MKPYTSKIPQGSYLALALVGTVLAAGTPVLLVTLDLSLGQSLALMGAGIGFAIYGLLVYSSSNFHRITSGTVTGHHFTPAHMGTMPIPVTTVLPGPNGVPITSTTVTVVPHWYEDTWTLTVTDAAGHTATFEYASDPSADHPVGSTYTVR